MKVFISADMEGIAGVVSRSEVLRDSKEYPEWRRAMTLEVNAAIEGAFEAGAREVVVNDSHGAGRNLLPDLLHPDALLSRGQPLPSMVAPLDASFDASLLVGYHAMRGAERAVLDHTYSYAFNWIKVNGRETGEIGMAAAYAAHFGVPTVFVSGDDKTAAEARAFIPGVATVETKQATGRTSAISLSPEKARQAVREGVAKTLRRQMGRDPGPVINPLVLEGPLVLEMEFADLACVDQAACLPGVERVGGRAVRTTFQAMPETLEFLSMVYRVAGA